jgi:hypothetical protein
MNDDWRVQVTCPTPAAAADLGKLLRDGDFKHELEQAAGDRVVASVDDNELFLYAATRAQAEKAGEAVKTLAAPAGVTVHTELRRWHPGSEEWVDADLPLPASEADAVAEHAELIAQEREESAAMHYSEYEVRVESHSHRDIVELAKRLRDEGIPSVRRWHFLLVGAADEDAANVLAERIKGEVPAGSTVTVEASFEAIEAETPGNPFAVFGGLGG